MARRANLQTSLARARGLGSAATGTGDFWRQRVTSVLGLPLTAAAIVIVVSCIGEEHAAVHARLAHPLVALVLLLAILNTVLHMWIGMQVVIEDYVHAPLRKILLLTANTGFCAAIALAGVVAILEIQ